MAQSSSSDKQSAAERILRVIGLEIIDPVVHVHDWKGGDEHYDSWLLGPVQVGREYCRCSLQRMRVIGEAGPTQWEVTKTREQVRRAYQTYLDPQTRLARRALALRALRARHLRYRSYQDAQQGSMGEHRRFDTVLMIVLSLHEKADADFLSYRSTVKEAFDVAVDLMNEIDVVELALYGRSPALLSEETFDRLVQDAQSRMQLHAPPEPEAPEEASAGPGKLHWHRWSLVDSQRLYSPEHRCAVDVVRKGCRCGQEREVISKDLPLGAKRVLQIRPLA